VGQRGDRRLLHEIVGVVVGQRPRQPAQAVELGQGGGGHRGGHAEIMPPPRRTLA
jgi:hypothetical protein